MFEEKHLKTLRNIKVDEEKKQADFDKIIKRGKQKVVDWPIFALIVSIVSITLFLIATSPLDNQMATTTDDSQLIAVYTVNGNGNPKSALQLHVNRVTNEKALDEIWQVYNQLQITDKPDATSKVYASYRFNFSDNTSKLYYQYIVRQKIYYEDASTGQYYKREDGSGIPLIQYDQPTTLHTVAFFSLFVLLIGSFVYVDRQMRDKSDPKRKLPKHSHTGQSVLTLLFLLSLFILLFSIPNIHFMWIVGSSLAVAFINILIENKYGNNNWRKLSFLLFGLLVPTYLYLSFVL
ncbi:hypothetical protein [Solibacillus merdavium]|uniref:Uncharacterized protein n=1 Tax=Solibacillus merdavium TaxID=2762218 RepID=A0ABR8XNH7_9BACL|nr:hypothetical protein [Solibacillus merdavium]MBD8033480.1 hypothetical protein [Solibacillus merdavium]